MLIAFEIFYGDEMPREVLILLIIIPVAFGLIKLICYLWKKRKSESSTDPPPASTPNAADGSQPSAPMLAPQAPANSQCGPATPPPSYEEAIAMPQPKIDESGSKDGLPDV